MYLDRWISTIIRLIDDYINYSLFFSFFIFDNEIKHTNSIKQ